MHMFSCFSSCIHAPAKGTGARCGAPMAQAPPPIMETCVSEALTNTTPVQILSGDAKPWRVASPQDQQLLSQLSPDCLTPLTLLGEGAYGCVELCRVSIPIPMNSCGEDAAGQQPVAEQRCTSAHADSSTMSHLMTDSCEDPFSNFRNPRAAGPSSAAGSVTTVLDGATGSESVVSPREGLIVRPGGFSVNRVCVSPHASDPPGPSPCATPPAASRHAPCLRQNTRHGPLRASAPAGGFITESAGFVGVRGGKIAVGLATGDIPASAPAPTASCNGMSTPTSSLQARPAPGPYGNGGYAWFALGSLFTRARSAGSATAAQLLPPSARSARLTSASSAAASPSPPPAGAGRGGVTVSAKLSNELVVAVKRIGYRRPANRSVGGRGREADGCTPCSGGVVGRGGRGGRGGGPSRTRLNRMQAIELLQLARCRECPFIVRVFGCVQDDPRPALVSVAADDEDEGEGFSGAADVGGNYAATGIASTPKQSPMPSKLSLRRPPPASSSSSYPSCRIVMEWAEGGDLGSLIKTLSARRGPCSDPARERLLMSEASARFYFACLLEALSFLHGKGLLHRDVKPANLLLTSDGRAKLGDLGMVCHMDREGLAAGRAGTPNYMAPEVWAYGTAPKYSSYGANADLWSAGLILHEMLTGHLPASHPDEYLRRSWCFTPRHSALSPELRDLLGRLLVPRPRGRLQSCAEVVGHPWFAGFDWQGLRDGTLAAPYVPAAHRPPCNAVSASAVRLRPLLGAALAAAAGASISAAPCTIAGVGGGVELMPPLLEENAAPSSAGGAASDPATVSCHAVSASGSQAAASRKSIFRVASAGALRQSAPAGVTGPATATALLAAAPAAIQAEQRGRFTASLTSVSGRGTAAVLQPTLRSASTGAAAHYRQPPSPPPLASGGSPDVSKAGPMSVWGMLGWPAATRPSPAAASAPVSVASSMTSSTAAMSPPQGIWRRHGASHAGGHGGDAARAVRTAACPVSIGAIGAMLSSALGPVVSSCPRPVSTSAPQGSASAAASFNGDGTPTRMACTVSAVSDAGMAELSIKAVHAISVASPGRLGQSRRSASGVQNRACCASPALRTSCDTDPLLMSTAAIATSRVSDGVQLRCSSSCETFSADSGGGDEASSIRGHCHDMDKGVGSAELKATGSRPNAFGLEPPLAEHTTANPSSLPQSSLTRSLGYRHAAARSTEPTLCSAGHIPKYERGQFGSPGSRTAPSVCSAPLVTSPQSGFLGAISSLQVHVQGLGPTGRRAGTWLQQRLADAATLAATLPEHLHMAAAAAAAVVVGGGRGCSEEPPAASAASRLSESEGPGASGEGRAPDAIMSSVYGRRVVGSGDSDASLQICSEAGGAVQVNIAHVGTGVQGGGAPFCEPPEACHHLSLVSGGSSNASPADPEILGGDISAQFPGSPHGTGGGGGGGPMWQLGDGAAPPSGAPDPNHHPAGNRVAADGRETTAAFNDWRTASSCHKAQFESAALCAKPCDADAVQNSNNSHEGASWPTSPRTGPRTAPPTVTDLTRAGADAATVLVLVRRNTGCGDTADTGVVIVEEPTTFENPSDVRISDNTSGIGNMPIMHNVHSLTTTTHAAALGTSAKTVITLSSSRKDESFSASSPRQAASQNVHNLPAHKRTGSFCFDPLDPAARLACQHPGSPNTPKSSSAHPSATAARSHTRGTSFSFDVGGLLSAGLLLGSSSSTPLLSYNPGAANGVSSGIAPTAGGHPLPGGFAAGRHGTSPNIGAAAEVAVSSISRLSSPRGARPWLQCFNGGSNSTSGGDRISCLQANGSRPSDLGSGPACSDPSSVALGALGQGSGSLSGENLGPMVRVPNPRHGALEYHAQAWHQFPAGEAVVLLYAACMAVLVMAWAVICEGPETAI